MRISRIRLPSTFTLHALKNGWLSWHAGKAPVAGPEARLRSLRVEPLPSSGFHRLHRYYGLVRLLVRPSGLGSPPCARRCGGPHRPRSPAFNAFLSQRAVPATPGECAVVSNRRAPSHPAFANLQEARPPLHFTRLHLGSRVLRPAASQPCDCGAQLSGVASAGCLTAPRRTPGYVTVRLFIAAGSFHPARSAASRRTVSES